MPSKLLAKKTPKWAEEQIDSIIEKSEFGKGLSVSEKKSEWKDLILKYYQYYNGEIDPEDYKTVLKPYGKERDKIPADIRNYNIIRPAINTLLGEKINRPLNHSVIVTNPDVKTKKQEEKRAVLGQLLKDMYVNELNNMGVDTGVENEETPLPEEVEDVFERTYRDQRAIIGQQAINYIVRVNELEEQFDEGFFDWLVAGVVVSKVGTDFNDPYFQLLNPLDVDFAYNSNLRFIEDAEWAVHKMLLRAVDVVDMFKTELTKSDIDRLEEPKHTSYLAEYTSVLDNGFSFKDEESKLIEVLYVTWRTVRKMGILYTMDPETGVPTEEEVQEGYKTLDGEEIEWLYVNEVWEGYRIDGDIYKRVRPVPVQRRTNRSQGEVKLPINGRVYSNRNASPVSFLSLLIPYQLDYNTYRYRLSLSMAKNKDRVVMLDINLRPKDWGMDKWLEFMEGTGIVFVNYNQETVRNNPQHQSVLDLSVNTIEQYVRLLSMILEEVDSISGVNRQRKGQISQYDNNGNTEQAIVNASNITEDIFSKFLAFESRILQSLLDYSKISWINGKQGMYTLDDGSEIFLDIDGMQYQEAELGIFVSNKQKDRENLSIVRQLVQAMVQNGASISTIVDALEANSLTELKDKIRKEEQKAAEQMQTQQEQQMQLIQEQKELEMFKIENDNRQKELDRINKLEIALLSRNSRIDDQDGNKIDDGIDRMKIDADRMKQLEELKFKREELSKKVSLERDKISNQKLMESKKLELEKIKMKHDKELKLKDISARIKQARRKTT